MVAESGSPRTRPRDAIVEAVGRVLAERGFEAASIKAIAARRFPLRIPIFRAAARADRVFLAIEPAAPAPRPAPPATGPMVSRG